MEKEKINIPGLEKYDVTGGTIMLTSKNKDSEIGVTPLEVAEFMKEFAEKHEDLLYYSVRKSGKGIPSNNSGLYLYTRVNVDFGWAVEKDDNDVQNSRIGQLWDRKLKHEFYKAFGGAVEGWDISARFRTCYINTKLLNYNSK